MRAIAGIGKLATRYLSDRRGNFGLVTAVMAPMLMLAAGYGLNVSQMVMTRSNLLSALDSAVTSTARDLTTGVIDEKDARKVVEAFLLANGDRGFSDAERITLDSLVIDPQRGTVSAEASVVVDVLFPVFGTENRQKITTRSASLYSDKNIEIALMLDVTGSMEATRKTDKIGDLKTAAKNAVDLLLEGQDEVDPRIRVALVPYAEAVNVGKLAKDTVFVESKNASNLPPRIGAKKKEIEANTGKQVDNCATERKDRWLKTDFTDDAPDTVRTKGGDSDYKYLAKVNRDDRLLEHECPDVTIAPLTADADELKDAIEDYEAAGNTAGGIGIQWTYYMLSPEWRRAIRNAGLGDGPADHDPENVAKIAIIMTDGQFNSAFVGDGSEASAKSRNNAEGLCDAMKEDGIEIFTIGFDLNNKDMSKSAQDQAKGVLKNCASPDVSRLKHFYEASTGEELDEAYKAIIRNVEQLYLTM